MAFGILEDHKLYNVPGTGLLSAIGSQVTTSDATELKRGTGRSSHIVLMPQPSDDPNDPLNWPRWKKEACYWTLLLASSLAAAISPLASAAYVQLAEEFNVSVDQVASSFSAAYIGNSIFLLLQAPFATKYGYRIMYLVSAFLMFVSSIWCALSTDLVSIRASRIFQGFGIAPPLSIVPISIGQLFFVHERSTRMAIYTLVQLSGSILATFINGYINQNMSWRFGFWFMSIACGLCLLGTILFVPETTYHRHSSPNLDFKPTTKTASYQEDRPSAKLPSFLSGMKFYNGTFSEESMWKIFFQPFPFLLSPVAWFMIINTLVPALFLGLVSLCASTIFTVTYSFTTSQIGLTALGGLVGTVLGMVVAGPLGDWWILWSSQRNHGVYEPEFRLVLMSSLLFGVFGYVGWAIGNDNHMPWIGAVACLTMLYFSTVVSATTLVPYGIDAHGHNALHIICIEECARNILIYGSAFFANSAILSIGIRTSLIVYGAGQAVCWLTSVMMYVFGKRVRSFIARHPSLFNRDLQTSELSPSLSRSGTDSKD